jgi:hypothetical protein
MRSPPSTSATATSATARRRSSARPLGKPARRPRSPRVPPPRSMASP